MYGNLFNFVFFFKVVLTSLGPLHFQMNIEWSSLSIPIRKSTGVMFGAALNLYINLWRNDTLAF